MLYNNRLGQGLPLSTIILAALGLLVLLVLGFIFTRGTSDFRTDLKNAQKSECPKGYELKPVGTSCEDVIYGNFADQICCKEKQS